MTEKRLIISANTAVQISKIFDRYIEQYGNITIKELVEKFDRDVLILN